MKSSIILFAVVLSACVLNGCSSMEQKSTYVAPQPVSYPNDVKVETDAEYIAAVERIARRRGITLQWINLPTKRTTVASQ